MSNTNTVVIDLETKNVKSFMAALKRLKGTTDLQDQGEYNYGCATGYSKLLYTGAMDANGVDSWAYKVKAASGFVGAVDVLPAPPAEVVIDVELCKAVTLEKSADYTPPVGWTTARNLKGEPIHGNTKLAHIYAEMDYHGMTKDRDTRSRNKREGRYAGTCDGKPARYYTGQNIRGCESFTSGYYLPTRKARKAAYIHVLNSTRQGAHGGHINPKGV